MKVLLVKMSSLGDVVHALPAVADAAAHGHQFHWVVEEAFDAIPALHPAVTRVVPIAWRRWRADLADSRQELAAFVRTLRREPYDLVLDSQGLFKSAMVAALARGPVAGFDRASAREGGASVFYRHQYHVPRASHAVDRQRRLFAHSLGYEPDLDREPDLGNVGGSTAAVRDDSVVLLHGTTWDNKHWPETMWTALAERCVAAGYAVQLPWGGAAEQARAERIAAAVSGASVLPRLTLGQLGDRLRRARLVVGVDSGLSHLAGVLGAPTLVLYGPTDPALTGCRGAHVVNLGAGFACAPCLARQCSYRGDDQLWMGQPIQPACFAALDPDTVWRRAHELLAMAG